MAEYSKDDPESMGEYLRENSVSWELHPPWVWKCRCNPKNVHRGKWCYCVAPRYKIDSFSLDCHWRPAKNEDWDFSDSCAKDCFNPEAGCAMLFNACNAVSRVAGRRKGE